ncbi:hypothetical protein DTO271G3_3713 [Paecilomyces variotii]|nr:hypothetical protein DTO271G3_3713 [Paecilomyces variotii]
MSELRNIESLNNKQGEFKPGVAPSVPGPETKGHQLGVKASPADYAPEFHAQVLPPGTAPASSSYQPNPINETPGQANNPDALRGHGKESTYTAANSIPGATSKDVHRGLGHPGVGETNNEIRHDGQHHRKRAGQGLEGVGASRPNEPDERARPDQRGIEREEARGGQHGDKGALAAEDKQPESAETIAAEWHYEPSTKRNHDYDQRYR